MKLASFGRNKRLVKSSDFQSFFHQSQCIRLGYCRVFRMENTKGHYRLGITLKARGRSVDRNKVKRCIRESFRQKCTSMYDYNVVIDSGTKIRYPFFQKLHQCLDDAHLNGRL